MKGFVHDEDLSEFAEDLTDYREVTLVKGHGGEVEAEIIMPNPAWGLPGDIEDLMIAYGVIIKDFSHVSKEGITVYFDMR